MDGHQTARESIKDAESLARQLERERDLTIKLLRLANLPNDLHGLMRAATKLLQQWSGCTAVGVRLREGDDFPYFETRGFPAEFIQAENSLCAYDVDGQLARDCHGDPVLECMCGNILCGRFNAALSFITPGGSFWTNSTSQLLASTTEADRAARTRNRRNGEGYESVALIPLRADNNTFGLLQLNDPQAGKFNGELIATLEALAAALAEAMARRMVAKELQASRDELRGQLDERQENERNLRGLLDAVDQSVMLLEPDGTILECNQTFAERLGYAREELLGRDVYALLPPEVAEQRRQGVEEVQRLRSAVSFVDERWGRRMTHRVVPILDDDENLVRFAVQGADITDQSRLANDLQASNEILDAIKDAQALFIAERDPKEVFAGLLEILVTFTQSEYGFLDEVVYQNEHPVLKRSLAISDISWDEESRKLYQELVGASFVFLNLENLASAPAVSGEVVVANDPSHDSRSQGVPHGHPPVESFLGIPMRYGGEVVGVAGVANRDIHKDGKIAWAHLSVRLLNDQAGQPSGFLSMIVDITDRKHMETVVRDSEALLTQAEEIVGMGSFIWDVDSDGFSASSGMHRLYGLNAHEFPNSFRNALLQLVHPQDQDRIRDEADRMVAERRAWPVEFRIVRSDGQGRAIHCESQAVLGPDGRPTRYVGTLHDITRRRADEVRLHSMQLQLHHASRLAVMGELAASIAHEVNQPLCSIVNFAKACQNVASREPANLEQIRQWTAAINTAATRAGDIVQGLLKSARRHGPNWESVTVRGLIDDAVLLVPPRC